MRAFVLGGILAVGLPALVSGQGQAPTPGPEYRRLDYFVGTWKAEGEQKPNPAGIAGGKLVGSMTCSKFAGGFHVVCNFEGAIGGTPYREMVTFSYDPEEKTYTWFDIDSTGMNGMARGALQAGSWTFVFEMKAGGRPLKLKVALTEQSPTVLLNKAEVSVDGQLWATLIEAKFTKTK